MHKKRRIKIKWNKIKELKKIKQLIKIKNQ